MLQRINNSQYDFLRLIGGSEGVVEAVKGLSAEARINLVLLAPEAALTPLPGLGDLDTVGGAGLRMSFGMAPLLVLMAGRLTKMSLGIPSSDTEDTKVWRGDSLGTPSPEALLRLCCGFSCCCCAESTTWIAKSSSKGSLLGAVDVAPSGYGGGEGSRGEENWSGFRSSSSWLCGLCSTWLSSSSLIRVTRRWLQLLLLADAGFVSMMEDKDCLLLDRSTLLMFPQRLVPSPFPMVSLEKLLSDVSGVAAGVTLPGPEASMG